MILPRRPLDAESKIFSWLVFFFNRRSFHPRKPWGKSQSGRKKKRDERFQARTEEHKIFFVLMCPIIGEKLHLLSSFPVFVHDGYYLTILVRFVHQRVKCTLSIQTNVYPKTKTWKSISTGGGYPTSNGRRKIIGLPSLPPYHSRKKKLLIKHLL